jgi:hypothetical protein
MSWLNFRLTSAELAKDGSARVLKLFEAEFTRLGEPSDMAMFSTQQPGEDYATYYLSPATEVRAPDLIRILGAQPGERPPQGVTLMVGENNASPCDS